MNLFIPCIIIPIYNHAYLIKKNIHKILDFPYPVILVNDGGIKDREILIPLYEKYKKIKEDLSFIDLETNRGKGYAFIQGLEYAKKKGYTHALQMDADFQHSSERIPLFFKTSKLNPTSLIVGTPLYDKDIPKKRLWGRKISNFFVKLETFSNVIKDSMCGFRVYPIKETSLLLKTTKISYSMGFDIDILVKLHRLGIKIISLPVEVHYPLDGFSNFKLVRDNIKISVVHMKLCCNIILLNLKSLLKIKH